MSDSITNNAAKPKASPIRGNIVFRTVVIVAVVASVVVLALSLPSAGRTLTQATTKQPEAFTELYFSDHLNLPKKVTVGRETTVTYHITNHEALTTVYQPRVTLFENGTGRVISQTAVVLQDGQGQDLTASFTPEIPNANLELIIDLPDQNQSIHFRSQS